MATQLQNCVPPPLSSTHIFLKPETVCAMSELSTVSFLQDCKYLFFCHYILTAQKNNVSLDLCKIQWLFNTCAHFCAAQQTSILQFVKFSSGARNSFATLPHRCVLCVVVLVMARI